MVSQVSSKGDPQYVTSKREGGGGQRLLNIPQFLIARILFKVLFLISNTINLLLLVVMIESLEEQVWPVCSGRCANGVDNLCLCRLPPSLCVRTPPSSLPLPSI